MCKYSSNNKELEIGSLDISPVSCLIELKKLHKFLWGKARMCIYLLLIFSAAINALTLEIFARGWDSLRYCEMMQWKNHYSERQACLSDYSRPVLTTAVNRSVWIHTYKVSFFHRGWIS